MFLKKENGDYIGLSGNKSFVKEGNKIVMLRGDGFRAIIFSGSLKDNKWDIQATMDALIKEIGVGKEEGWDYIDIGNCIKEKI